MGEFKAFVAFFVVKRVDEIVMFFGEKVMEIF